MSASHRTISDEVVLYRRLRPDQVIWDANTDDFRATSNAFKDPDMSVALGDTLDAIGRAPAWILRLDPRHQLALLTARVARQEEQVVKRDPLVAHERYGDDPTHGLVQGPKPKSRRNRLVAAADVVILRPEGLNEQERARFEALEREDPKPVGWRHVSR